MATTTKLKITNLGIKLLNTVTIEPINLIEIVRRFAYNYYADWKEIREYYEETDNNAVPK